MDKQKPQHSLPRSSQGSASSSGGEIIFRPLSEGLGFHPFSDGLPYAPIAKNPSKQANSSSQPVGGGNLGAGATLAGPPQMAPSARPPVQKSPFQRRTDLGGIPQISVPVVKPRPQVEPKAPGSTAPSISSSHHPMKPVKSVTSVKPVHAEFIYSFGFSYLLKRVLAYWIDLVMSFGVCIGILSSLIWIQESNAAILLHPSVLLVMAIFALALHWVLMTFQEVVFKTTVGKRIFGLNFKARGSTLFFRAIFFIPSVFFLGLGLAWGLFDRQKRCWHDRVFGVQPLDVVRL